MKEFKLNDCGVVFNREGHTYHLGEKRLQGITSTLIELAYPKGKTYAGVSDWILSRAADRGTACHQSVGDFYTIGIYPPEYGHIVNEAKRLLESEGLTPIRFEYIVTDFEHYASGIDIVCANSQDELCIVDMKFTAKLHLEQVTLQTSIYQRFFHMVNPELQATRLYVLWIHTNESLDVLESGITALVPVKPSFIDALIDADQNGTPLPTAPTPPQKPIVPTDVIQAITTILEAEERLKTLKETLRKAMQENGVSKWECDNFTATLTAPTVSRTFDSKKFKAENPSLYGQYVKDTPRAGAFKLALKKQKSNQQ